VAAAGHHHQPLVAHVDDGALVIHDQRIGLPDAVAPGPVDRESLFELGRAGDLSGDEERFIDEHRGTDFFDDLDLLSP
jgi:hypothetical protein